MEVVGGPDESVQGKILKTEQAEAIDKAALEGEAEVVTLEEMLTAALEEINNPLAAVFKKLGKTVDEYKKSLSESQQKNLEQKIAPPNEIGDEAEKAAKDNPDLNKEILKELPNLIKYAKNKEEVLNTLRQLYQDPALVYHALVFLTKVTKGPLQEFVKEALELHSQVFEIGISQAVEEFVKKEALVSLLETAKAVKTPKELLDAVHNFYPDATIGEYVLKALVKATTGDQKKIAESALKSHSETHARELKAQSSILESLEVRAGVETPKVLEKIYRDFLDKPLVANQMLTELLDKYGPKDSRKITAYLLHTLGSDLKTQGTAIEPGKLSKLVGEIRALQSVIGVLQFYKTRLKLLEFLFKKEHMELPKNLKVEELAKTFVGLTQDRYPTQEKVLQSMNKFGSPHILGQILIISQMRDGTKEVSLKLFRRDESRDDSIENRDRLFTSILETLESLETDLDAMNDETLKTKATELLGENPEN